MKPNNNNNYFIRHNITKKSKLSTVDRIENILKDP